MAHFPLILSILVFHQVLGIPIPNQNSTFAHYANFTSLENHDQHLNVLEIIQKHNYPLEVHGNIETEDGYILEIHRIPHGRIKTEIEDNSIPDETLKKNGRPVVFLMHGILCSSADWVIMGPDKGLAFILADQGYDVWMGNARGNTWSKKHRSLSPAQDKFWDFSWHEIGVYDLPAMIDYIVNKTSVEKFSYVGHSQGTTSFFVMVSEKPEYNEKIKVMVALAPVAFMENVPSQFVLYLANLIRAFWWVPENFMMMEFLPKSELRSRLSHNQCHDQKSLQVICSNILFLIAGIDAQLNKTMIPSILANTPAGSSTKQFLHYSQGVVSGQFQQYDHGTIGNLMKYGKSSPPLYNLSNVRAPVALFYGANDHLASIVDVERLHKALPNAILNHLLEDKMFSHLDFLWGVEAPQKLYGRILDVLEQYS